jgi:hypothetical protein
MMEVLDLLILDPVRCRPVTSLLALIFWLGSSNNLVLGLVC